MTWAESVFSCGEGAPAGGGEGAEVCAGLVHTPEVAINQAAAARVVRGRSRNAEKFM